MKNENIFLNNRTVLKISGSNYLTFLNNILTSDTTKIKSKEVTPSALLSPQGRVLFDILISLGPVKNINDIGSILIECEVTQADDLFKKISIYNLRKEVTIEKTTYKVFVTKRPKENIYSLIDKRFFQISIGRFYKDIDIEDIDLEYNETSNKDINWYNSLRYINCIPEGPKEIIPNVSLPLEINLDLLGGISFEKGCFIGQEVNARVKWKGLIKKKYVPIILESKDLSKISFNIDNKNKIFLKDIEIGKIISLAYDKIVNKYFGIAIIKLIHLYNFEQNLHLECHHEESKIKIKFPQYLLPLPKKS
jgi:tRNA-modifying protein YgfZ